MTERKCVCCGMKFDDDGASRIYELCMRCYQDEIAQYDEPDEPHPVEVEETDD